MLRKQRGDDGAALVIALVFLVFISVLVTASLDYAFTDIKATPVVRANRALAYDADAAMEQAIAEIRIDPTQGVRYSCDPQHFPHSLQTNQSADLRVNCTPQQVPQYYQRHVQLQVCYDSDASCA